MRERRVEAFSHGNRLEVDAESRVRARYGDAVIVFRGIGGADWGWYTREDPRLHIQTVNESSPRGLKVWLERSGARAFEPEGRIPARTLGAIKESVLANGTAIEAKWTNFMIEKGWLEARLTGRIVEITAYPGAPTAFHRQIDIDAELPGLRDRALSPRDLRLDAEHAALMIFADRGDDAPRVFLPDVLWSGQRTA